MKKLVAFLIVSSLSSTALAGGYDTPILYSARHLGTGGAAVADVRDGSALFHNPAGLGQIGRANVIGNFSAILGKYDAVPSVFSGQVESPRTFAPGFLVGGGFRVHDNIVLGLGVYPVAAASGYYKYQSYKDETRLVFFEASPGIAFNFDKIGLRLGIGYRITYVTLKRVRGGALNIDSDLKGFNFASFRAGFQWRLHDTFTIGASYRHKNKTDIEQNGGTLISMPVDKIEATFTLPARISGGFRFDYAAFGFITDLEYGFNSQNDPVVLTATPPIPLDVASAFEWKNQFTFRTGVEYRFVKEKLPIRLGFIYDARTVNRAYPTAFGTPASDTYTVTAGAGYDFGPFEMNVAYARRRGSTVITSQDLAQADQMCLACGGAGNYDLQMNGFYVDASYDW